MSARIELLAAIGPGGRTAKTIARTLNVPVRNALRVLNRLREAGHVTRRVDVEGHPVARWWVA